MDVQQTPVINQNEIRENIEKCLDAINITNEELKRYKEGLTTAINLLTKMYGDCPMSYYMDNGTNEQLTSIVFDHSCEKCYNSTKTKEKECWLKYLLKGAKIYE